MSSIDDAKIVRDLIENDGYYLDDPRLFAVVRYTNAWGGETYKLCYDERTMQSVMIPTQYVGNPAILWSVAGITRIGQEWLDAM